MLVKQLKLPWNNEFKNRIPMRGEYKLKYEVLKDIPNHQEIQFEVTKDLWPEFMFHDPVSNKYWHKLFELFPEYQFSLKSKGEIIGIGQCLPLQFKQPFRNLPEKGWEWALQKGIEDKLANNEPNILNGLQIAVDKSHQGQGVSTLILKEMANIAKEAGFNYVIIPIRPSLKSLYPLIDIDDYINWQREDGLPYDPWIRVHKRFGAEIIKVCHKAMRITGTKKDWEKWTDLKFIQSGRYVVKGALNPINMDLTEDLGEYIEPNIWVLHSVK